MAHLFHASANRFSIRRHGIDSRIARRRHDVGDQYWPLGRSLESGLTDFSFPIRPDFILTTERDVFRPGQNGDKWEAFGGWNERCAQDHTELFSLAQPVLAEVIDFVSQKTKARLIYDSGRLEGLVAENDEEMERITEFIEEASVSTRS